MSDNSDYPDFEVAISRLKKFLLSQNRPDTISWISENDVWYFNHQLIIDIDVDQMERVKGAENKYNEGINRHLGIKLECFCSINSRSYCYVWRPKDNIEKDYALQSDGIKLAARERQPVRIANWWRRLWKSQKWEILT